MKYQAVYWPILVGIIEKHKKVRYQVVMLGWIGRHRLEHFGLNSILKHASIFICPFEHACNKLIP